MFDSNKRRVAPKKAVWNSIKRGEIMRLTVDLEGSGVVKSGEGFSTPASPFITEYGDCLTDIAGNYVNSAQLFPRRPEHLIAQPAAVILQRNKNGPQDFDDPNRMSYFQAMAAIAWRVEQSAFQYEQIDNKRRHIEYVDHNKQLKHGQIDDEDDVIDVPLLDEDGNVVYDVRYHPEKQKVSYRFQNEDHEEFDYANEDNIYYRDKSDGSMWKWVDASIQPAFFNGHNYDIPILRSNFMRAGFDPADATFLYSRATPTNKQRKKNHPIDARHLGYAAALFGPQREDSVRIPELIEEINGVPKIRATEALAAYLEDSKRHSNPMRLMQGGAFMPNDGSFHDKALDHGAAYDAMGTSAFINLVMDEAPEIFEMADRQIDEKALYKFLTSQKDPDGGEMRLFSLPRRNAGKSHLEMPCYFLDSDDQMGRFKRLVFLNTDGNLHTKRYNGRDGDKLLKDLSVEEWVEYMESDAFKKDPDSAVQIFNLRKMPTAIPLEYVTTKSSMAQQYRDRLGDVKRDVDYITENPQMQERIRAAQAVIQRKMRFDGQSPQNPFMEDEFPGQFSGECPYLDDPHGIQPEGGPREIHPIVKTIKSRHDNVYKNYMREMDRALRMLSLRAHLIDHYNNYKKGDSLGRYVALLSKTTQIDIHRDVDLTDHDDERVDDAKAHLDDFKDLTQQAYNAVYADKSDKGRTIFDDLINPATGQPFFQNGRLEVETLNDAYILRRLMNAHMTAARRVLNNFSSLVDDTVQKKFENKKWAYQDIIKGMQREPKRVQRDGKRVTEPGEPFFSGRNNNKSNFASPRDAFEFRRALGKRIMTDYQAELRTKNSPYITGLIDKTFCEDKGGKKPHRLLIADPDNGEKGATPHIVDENGREQDITYLKGQSQKDVLKKLASGEWKERFHRLRSEPTIMRMMQRFVDLDMVADIPKDMHQYLYFADLQNRMWGMENENEHTARMANLVTFEFELRRLEIAATNRNAAILEKDPNPLLAEAAKAVQFDEGQRLLTACREWIDDMKERYQKHAELIPIGRHDPETGAPYDYIVQEIMRDESKGFEDDTNFVVMDVPARHLRHSVEQFDIRYPHKGVVVPDLTQKQLRALRAGKPPIFREMETGRLYSSGTEAIARDSVHLLPQEHNLAKGKHKSERPVRTLIDKARTDYMASGNPLNEDTKLYFVGITELSPVANTRLVEQNVQSFKLSGNMFDALTYPQLSGFGDRPITTIVLPLDYCPQHLTPNETVRLREMASDVFAHTHGEAGPETGHIYDSVLRQVVGVDESGQQVGMPLREFFRRVEASEFGSDFIASTGFSGLDHMRDHFRRWGVEGWKKDPDSERIIAATFDPVNAEYFANGRLQKDNRWAMFNSLAAPRTALVKPGQLLSPSAYRDYDWLIGNDAA